VAVTLQLLHVPNSLIAQAIQDPLVMQKVVSFDIEANRAYADFGWFTEIVKRIAPEMRLSLETTSIIDVALGGYRMAAKGDDFDVYSDIRTSDSEVVAEVSRCLDQAEIQSCLSDVSEENISTLLAKDLWDNVGSPLAYLRAEFKRLREFYDSAVKEDHGVLIWWD